MGPINLHQLQKVSDDEWIIPRSFRADMRVPVRIFASRRLIEAALGDQSLEQAVNAATLPGVVDHVVVMPDLHQGYGFPIGGVAATLLPDGVISPGAIGYDINCGVRLLASSIPFEAVEKRLGELATALSEQCPSGVGSEGAWALSSQELDQVCQQGARWALKKGFASEQDLRRTEEGGCLAGADPQAVSAKARERGRAQLGSLGAGNHFIEVDVVDEIFDPQAAEAMGLYPGCLAVMIHCGSRGFGHQICTDYVHSMQAAVKKYGITLPDRELVCAPLNSPEGEAYLGAMRAAANYAFANRQLLAHQARQAFELVFSGARKNWHLYQVYDVAHNMGKIETHRIEGKPTRVCVHRKGATRAFGPGSAELPQEYQAIGQPVLVPGSMGTASWVLVGTSSSMERALGSSCHGAGRRMSRSKARQAVQGRELWERLEREGIRVRAGSLSGLAEEAPQAYKDVDEVVRVVAAVGIARRVARLEPVAVVKG